MSTYDVPGTNPSNGDELAMGCWAEHEDGSLIFVESTEGNRIIYSIFDISKQPPIEYRDAMPESSFKKTFTWDKAGKKKDDKWLWHDKTPFPWDRVIKHGFPDGGRFAAAEHQLSAAERVAESLKLRGAHISRDLGHRVDQVRERTTGLFDKLSRALAELGK
jgi:hypothetical protein